MAITHGMDVQAVRTLAKQMDTSAEQIQTLASKLTAALNGTAWVGKDRENFMGQWQAHSKQLATVVNSLKETANKARANAQQQENASNSNG